MCKDYVRLGKLMRVGNTTISESTERSEGFEYKKDTQKAD